MKEQLGTDHVVVCAGGIWVGLQKYQIPFKARMFILNFDSGLPVDPLAFLMEVDPGPSQPVVQRGGKSDPPAIGIAVGLNNIVGGYVTTRRSRG
jgi:hypothetical protein